MSLLLFYLLRQASCDAPTLVSAVMVLPDASLTIVGESRQQAGDALQVVGVSVSSACVALQSVGMVLQALERQFHEVGTALHLA